MKNTKRRALYVVAALLAAIFVVACLAGFAACGGDDENGASGCDHSFTWTTATAATCTAEGTQTGTCSKCGETVTAPLPALGHDFSTGTHTDADCATLGSTVMSCSRCDATVTIEGGSKTDAHAWSLTKSTAATCTKNGSEVYTCSVCDTTASVTTPATGHTVTVDDVTEEEDWEVIKEATCGEDGVQMGVCSVCGETIAEVIPATGDHTYDWANGTATASVKDDETGEITTEGYVTYSCSVCGDRVTGPYYNEGGEYLFEAEDGLLYPDPSTSTLSFGVEEHHSGKSSGNPASGGQNIKDFADGSYVAFRINASAAVTGATLTVIGASNNSVMSPTALDMSNACVTLNGCQVVLSGTYPAGGFLNYSNWSDNATATIDLASGDNALVFYGMAKDFQYNFDCFMISLPEGCVDVTLSDTTKTSGDFNPVIPDYSVVADTDGEYSRVWGSSEDDAESFYWMDNVHFDGSVVEATLGGNKQTWTLSGTAGTMTAEQAEAFWVDETVSTDHVGDSYIAFGVTAGEGEVVTMMTSGGMTETLSGATAQSAKIKPWIFDLTTTETEGWFMTVTVADTSGNTLWTYTIVIGDIVEAASE